MCTRVASAQNRYGAVQDFALIQQVQAKLSFLQIHINLYIHIVHTSLFIPEAVLCDLHHLDLGPHLTVSIDHCLRYL